jgi:hypothetical protein
MNNCNQSLQPFCNNKTPGLYHSAPCITVVIALLDNPKTARSVIPTTTTLSILGHENVAGSLSLNIVASH